jgi:hypothetical protein
MKKSITLFATAWVLWSQNVIDGHIMPYAPINGAPTYEMCQKFMEIAYKNAEKRKTNNDPAYVCLPDTIDPRGAKQVEAK